MKTQGLVFVVLGLVGATVAVTLRTQDSLREKQPTPTPTVTPTPVPTPIPCDSDECSSCCDSNCQVVACDASEGKKCGGSCPANPNKIENKMNLRRATCNVDSDNNLECELCQCPQEWYDEGIPSVMDNALKSKLKEIATSGDCKLADFVKEVNVICAMPNNQPQKLYQCKTKSGACIVNERDYDGLKMTVTSICGNTGTAACGINPVTGTKTCYWGTTICYAYPEQAVVTFANKCGDACQPVSSGTTCDQCYVSKSETKPRPPPKCVAPFSSTRRAC